MNDWKRDLREELRDYEFRHAYLESALDSRIATQIRLLRKRRGLTQMELSRLLGTGQSRVSTMEDVNYSAWNIKTLKRLAEAFDVALSVKFESFGDMLPQIEDMSVESLLVSDFTNDPAFSNKTRGKRRGGSR